MFSENLFKYLVWIWIGILSFIIFPIYFVVSFLFVNISNWARKKKCITGEVAVITGAAGGLGKCIAAELATVGCHVAICDINYEWAESTAKELANKYGVKAKAYLLDVTKYKQIEEVNEKITKDLGAATILVNNAGVLIHADQLNPTVEEIQRMIDVNYMSHFLTNRVFIKNMEEANKGHIVAISSLAGLMTMPFSEPYCSSKTAVRTLMRTLRAELMLQNMQIGCTTVFPYFLTTHATVQKLFSRFNNMYPMMSGEETAVRIVQGMLRGEVEITMPGFFMLDYRLRSILPAKAQDWLIYMSMNKSRFLKGLQSLKKIS